MNKKSAMKQIEELEAKHAEEIAKLKAIIEAPDTSELVFMPKMDEQYEFVGSDGGIFHDEWDNCPFHHIRLKVGNVFRVGTAKNSAKYEIMNSNYDYWLPWSGQPKPKVLPKGLQCYTNNCLWVESGVTEVSQMCARFAYRWKRSEQVEK